MFKKILSLLLLSIFLMGCTNKVEEDVANAPTSKAINPSSTLSKTYSIKDISLNNEVSYSSKYSFLGNLIVFPDPNNNNKLSISNSEELNRFIESESITNFYEYYITNTININNSIYFTSNSPSNKGIFKFDYEKNTTEKINDYVPLNLAYQNGYLYFNNSNDKKLYSLEIKSNNVQLISNNKIGNFLVSNNFIIYQNLSDNSKLYAIKNDKTHSVKLTENPVDSFIALNNELLFFDSSNNNILSSLNLTNGSSERFSNIIGTNLKSDSNYIYFISSSEPNELYSLDFSNRNEVSSKLLIKDFINEYYPVDGKFFLEFAIAWDRVYILDRENIQKEKRP